jgi:hypothetical protein
MRNRNASGWDDDGGRFNPRSRSALSTAGLFREGTIRAGTSCILASRAFLPPSSSSHCMPKTKATSISTTIGAHIPGLMNKPRTKPISTCSHYPRPHNHRVVNPLIEPGWLFKPMGPLHSSLPTGNRNSISITHAGLEKFSSPVLNRRLKPSCRGPCR